MSGSRRSIRITSGNAFRRERESLGARRRLERLEPGARRARSAASFRFFSLSSTIRTSGSRDAVSLRVSSPCRSGSCIAEDHYLVREGVRRLLETQPDLEIAAVCGDLDSLLAAVDAEQPDVVVTDIRMPPGDTDEGIQAAARLRETHPDIGVVVLSQYATPSYALALLESGSARRAYLLKERVNDLDQLVAGDPRGRRRRLGDRSEGRRGAGRGERPRRGVAAATS